MAAAPAPPARAAPRFRRPRFRRRRTGPLDERYYDDTSSEALERFRGLVRDVRVAAQDLREAVSGLADGDPPVSVAASALERASATIEARIATIRTDVFGRFPSLYDDVGDSVMRLDTLWNRVLSEWPVGEAKASKLLVAAGRIDPLLQEMLFEAALVTVPDRLNKHLATIRIGKTLDFKEQFADELPDEGERRRMLSYLAAHPESVNGIVEPASGIVYKTDPRLSVRFATYTAPVAAALLGAGVTALAGSVDNWFNLDSWPEQMKHVGPLLTAYFFVLIGALVHVAVDVLKRMQARTQASFLAIGDLLAWLHVRYLSICASLLWVLVGVFGLAASTSKLRWDLAFLVGYSLDSVGGLFLQRFEATVGQRTKTLTGGSSGP